MGRLKAGQLAQALSQLLENVTSLDLSGNELHQASDASLAAAFSELPATINSLVLARNGLYKKTVAGLKTIFAGLPKTIHSVNLRQNLLGYNFTENTGHDSIMFAKTFYQVKQIIGAIPPQVSMLDLSQNACLIEKSPGEVSALKSLAPGRRWVNLTDNMASSLAPLTQSVVQKENRQQASLLMRPGMSTLIAATTGLALVMLFLLSLGQTDTPMALAHDSEPDSGPDPEHGMTPKF